MVLSAAAAYSIEIATLAIFASLALLYVCTGRKKKGINLSDYFSNKVGVSWFPFALTVFASGLGNWILFLPGDFSAEFSWAGLIGYVLGSALPSVIYIWIGPLVRKSSTPNEFTGTDFVRRRHGMLPYTVMTLVSLLFMWVALTAELTTIATTMQLLSGGRVSVIACIIPMALITLSYTVLAGLKASIFTDQFQAFFIILFGIIAAVAGVVSVPDGDLKNVNPIPFAPEGAWVAGSVLFLTIYPSELLNQGHWQRIFAVKSTRDLQLGYGVAVIGIIIFITIFGYGGIFAAGLPAAEGVSSGILLTVMTYLPDSWLVIVLILSVSLAASSIDTMQSAVGSLLGHELVVRKRSLVWARVVTVLMNIPAIVIASLQLNVLRLFSLANLLCLTVVVPNFLALHQGVTRWGVFMGCVAGLLTLLVTGWIVSESFIGGLAYLYPMDLSHISYVYASILTPVIACVVVFAVSWLEKYFARRLHGSSADAGGTAFCDDTTVSKASEAVTSHDISV